MNLFDTATIASTIEGIAIVGAAIVTSAGAFFTAHSLKASKKKDDTIRMLLNDTLALYAIEEHLLETLKQHELPSNKAIIRKEALEPKDLILSGKYTPAQAKRKLHVLKN